MTCSGRMTRMRRGWSRLSRHDDSTGRDRGLAHSAQLVWLPAHTYISTRRPLYHPAYTLHRPSPSTLVAHHMRLMVRVHIGGHVASFHIHLMAAAITLACRDILIHGCRCLRCTIYRPHTLYSASPLTCHDTRSVRLLAAFSFLACAQCARCCYIWPPRAAQPPRLRLATTRDTRPASPPPPWPSPSHSL